MDISRKTDYALRMLAMLVEAGDGLMSVRTAADEVDVPYSFARSIQHGLVQAGIVESLRGVRGGMRLARDPSEITVCEVVEAVQGPLTINDCTRVDGGCARMETCCFHPIWMGVQELVRDYLSSVTLDDVVRHTCWPAVSPQFSDRERFVEYASCNNGCLNRILDGMPSS